MNSTATKVRLLIVDDHTLFRESVARLLNAEQDFEVVADCGTIREALNVISNAPIDLVLLDFVMPRMNGYQFWSLRLV